MCYDECNFEDTASAAQILCQEKGSNFFLKECWNSHQMKLKKKTARDQKEESGKETACGVKKHTQKLKIFQGEWQRKDPKQTP